MAGAALEARVVQAEVAAEAVPAEAAVVAAVVQGVEPEDASSWGQPAASPSERSSGGHEPGRRSDAAP